MEGGSAPSARGHVRPQHHLCGLPSFVGSGFEDAHIIYIYYYLMCVCVYLSLCIGAYRYHVAGMWRSEVKFGGVGSLLPCGSWVLNSLVGLGGKHLFSR